MRLRADTRVVVERVGSRWEALRGACILVTGGTGFIGRWLLESFVAANREWGLDASAVVLTRRPREFARDAPGLVQEASITLHEGDVRELLPGFASVTHVIHGATPASATLNRTDPGSMFEVIELGTRRVLELCAGQHVQRLLLLSSGAVYRQPASPGVPLTEDSPFGREAPEEASAYHAGKRLAERLAWEAASDRGFALTIARPFAFVGPYLPLDAHFAIGNFIRDVLNGGPVIVDGDGTQVRSYLYAADMAAWLWAMLLDASAGGHAYNVGSELALSVADVARLVRRVGLAEADVQIRGHGGSSGGGDWDVPSTERARLELGVEEWTTLEDAVKRTIDWHKERRP
ncbi:MAG TPA: NAD(P)-dependent oxidoreductase [Candidatus Limnocylindrales bacterium]